MEFSIRGIGIIKEADIKMDGLTVIAGSNNSGKHMILTILQNIFFPNILHHQRMQY